MVFDEFIHRVVVIIPFGFHPRQFGLELFHLLG
jgi:hypothetical protein